MCALWEPKVNSCHPHLHINPIKIHAKPRFWDGAYIYIYIYVCMYIIYIYVNIYIYIDIIFICIYIYIIC